MGPIRQRADTIITIMLQGMGRTIIKCWRDSFEK